jgi:hypothetical protein
MVLLFLLFFLELFLVLPLVSMAASPSSCLLFIVKITLAAEVFAARAMEQSHSFSLWGG